MTTQPKIPGCERRDSIIRAARTVFAAKGFKGTTTRELAEAAGVSEALIFRHFPTKEALYSAIVTSVFDSERARFLKRFQLLESSTATLVVIVHELISHLLGGERDEERYSFFRLIIRSLMDEGELTRSALEGGPAQWVRKVAQCIEAARAAGDTIDAPSQPALGGWFTHHLITGVMLHFLPSETVIDYGVSQAQLVNEAVRFCLRGMGLKEEVIQHCLKEIGDSHESAS